MQGVIRVVRSVDLYDNYTLYEDGSIESKERVIRTATRGSYIRRKTDIHPIVSDSGYSRVHFRVNGKQVSAYVHKLVADNFLMNPQGFKNVHHTDGDKENNHVSNLEWRP